MTFVVDFVIENAGGELVDYCWGMVVFYVFDFVVIWCVFVVCGTSMCVLVLHEQLGFGEEVFYCMIELFYEDFGDDFMRLCVCEITFDRSCSTVIWRVDGCMVYEVGGTLIFEYVQMGFGIWIMLSIRDGCSCLLDG